MNSSIFVSIIVLHYKDINKTKQCIESIVKHTKDIDYEILLVNNGSPSEELEKLRTLAKDVKLRIVNLSKNYGYAGGNNIGARIAQGKYLVFLNNDVIVTNNWLNPLIEYLRHPDVGAVQSIILDKQGLVDNMGFIIDVYGNIVPLGHRRPLEVARRLCKNNCIEVHAFSGAAFATKKNLFIKLGGFDVRYFLYFEDIDLSWRIRNYGYKILCVCNSIVHHIHDKVHNSTKIKFRYYDKRNKILTYIRNQRFKYLPYFFLGLAGGLILDVIRVHKLKEGSFIENLIGVFSALKLIKDSIQDNKIMPKSAYIIKLKCDDVIRLWLIKKKYGYNGFVLYYEKVILT